MPTLTYSLSSFTKTNTDMKADTTFTAYASGTPVSNATISSGSLYLSSMKTYSGYCYLTFVLGSGSGTTANFLSNQTVHGETVTLTGYSAGLLTAGSGTITFTVRRSNTGTGNLLNIRDGLSGTLTLNYTLNTTACGAPTACSVNSTLSEGNVSLSWSGAAGGINNAISSYEVQYSDSTNGTTWGAWTALTTVTTSATSGSVSVAPPTARGSYRRFQVRTRGSAGASYYSGWKVSTNSVRRNTQPAAPTSVSASPAVYSTEAISLVWSGASGGTSAIKGYTITSRTSTDNVNWGGWATLTTLSLTAGSGSYTPTVSRVIGTYTQFGVATIDALDVASAVKTSASILCSITPCGLPSVFALSATLSEGAVTLSWSGASNGAGNTIFAYEIQYSDSPDASSWGTWTALSVLSSSATSGSLSVNPSGTPGVYRRFRLRIRGTAGEAFYSAWLVSSNTLRRNVPPTAPTAFTAAPAVYDTEQVTLTWSGAVAGTSAIKQAVIQQATSADGASWSAYTALVTLTTSATSGSYTPAVSTVPGMSTRYRLSLTDTLSAVSGYALSNTIRKASPPTAPVILSPKAGDVTYGTQPRFLITTGARLGSDTQKVCVRIGTAEWEDSVANPDRFSSAGQLANGVPTVFSSPALSSGSYTIAFRCIDSVSGAIGPEVVRAFTVLPSPFEAIAANVSKVKAAHIQEQRMALNTIRAYYSLSAVKWAEEVAAGKTQVKNWPFHVLELRRSLEQVIDVINGFDATGTNKIAAPLWLPMETGRPKASVMLQLQEAILSL